MLNIRGSLCQLLDENSPLSNDAAPVYPIFYRNRISKVSFSLWIRHGGILVVFRKFERIYIYAVSFIFDKIDGRRPERGSSSSNVLPCLNHLNYSCAVLSLIESSPYTATERESTNLLSLSPFIFHLVYAIKYRDNWKLRAAAVHELHN